MYCRLSKVSISRINVCSTRKIDWFLTNSNVFCVALKFKPKPYIIEGVESRQDRVRCFMYFRARRPCLVLTNFPYIFIHTHSRTSTSICIFLPMLLKICTEIHLDLRCAFFASYCRSNATYLVYVALIPCTHLIG